MVHVKCWVLKMNPPRLPYHLSNDIVRRGGVLWVEFWEAANGTSWSHSCNLRTYMTYIRAIREVCRIFILFAYIFHWKKSRRSSFIWLLMALLAGRQRWPESSPRRRVLVSPLVSRVAPPAPCATMRASREADALAAVWTVKVLLYITNSEGDGTCGGQQQ